jgi:hypothetical protein
MLCQLDPNVSVKRSVLSRSFTMKTLCFLKMPGSHYPQTWRHIPEERNPLLHHFENLKTNNILSQERSLNTFPIILAHK